MNPCPNSFIKGEPKDPPPVKAILLAVLSCLVFIGLLSAVSQIRSENHRQVVIKRVYESSVPIPDPPLPPDPNERFRIVPANFQRINFATRSYGNYKFSDGRNRELVLVDGQFREFGNSKHWFDLNDVYYTDLTGDGNPEAIVMMTHIECGRMCDGGKNLVFVYSQNYPLQEILKYESGSGIEGCSLKSLTVANRQLTLDLFGKCPPPPGILDDFIQREPEEVRRIEFFFNGKQLVPKKETFLKAPSQGDISHGPEIRIDEDRTPETPDF
jgi:hypothetical protein